MSLRRGRKRTTVAKTGMCASSLPARMNCWVFQCTRCVRAWGVGGCECMMPSIGTARFHDVPCML